MLFRKCSSSAFGPTDLWLGPTEIEAVDVGPVRRCQERRPAVKSRWPVRQKNEQSRADVDAGDEKHLINNPSGARSFGDSIEIDRFLRFEAFPEFLNHRRHSVVR